MNNIKNNIKILEYPKRETFENISTEEILKYIEDNQCFERKYQNDQQYYIGRNVEINKNSERDDKDNPDSRITVSYARTQTQIVKGYMYKQGLITYTSENKQYLETLQEIFDKNNEELKTSELGENQCKYGLGVELLYTSEDETGKTITKFTGVKPQECIFIYNMDIEPSLIGAIRYYIVKEDVDKMTKKYKVEVYYKDRVDMYDYEDQNGKKDITSLGSMPHYFNDIPFVLYENNQELHADYQPIKTLIDAYDVLMSDSINELNRFASAYLLLKNFILANVTDENEKRRKMEEIKRKRVIELLDDGDVTFLTRDIPSEFFNIVKTTLREDIEYHSHIPDFRSRNFDAKSGIAMRWALFDFENFCADKQALFEKGLQRRIKLINKILKIKEIDNDKVNIKFERNIPIDITNIVDNVIKLKTANLLPDEILLRQLKSIEIIDDVMEALELMAKQKEENMKLAPFDLDQGNQNADEEEKEENQN